MNDIGQKLRKSYFQALNGNITYEGGVIPIVDEKLDANITTHDIYVLMQEQNETEVPNRTIPITDCDMNMRIVARLSDSGNKEVVENISNQILNLLFPVYNRNALTIDSPLILLYAKKTGAEYLPLIKGQDGNFISSKTLTIKNRITQ